MGCFPFGRSGSFTHDPALELHLNAEDRAVGRAAFLGQEVLGGSPVNPRGELLQKALVVTRESVVVLVVAQQAENQLRGRLQSTIEKDRRHQGLEQIRLQVRAISAAGMLLAPSQLDIGVDSDGSRSIGQIPGGDQVGAELGQNPLAQIGVAREEVVADGQTEHGVAQKLQALIGLGQAVLIGVRLVQQGQLEQTGVLEPIFQKLLERFERVLLQRVSQPAC